MTNNIEKFCGFLCTFQFISEIAMFNPSSNKKKKILTRHQEHISINTGFQSLCVYSYILSCVSLNGFTTSWPFCMEKLNRPHRGCLEVTHTLPVIWLQMVLLARAVLLFHSFWFHLSCFCGFGEGSQDFRIANVNVHSPFGNTAQQETGLDFFFFTICDTHHRI